MNMGEWLSRAAKLYPENPAILSGLTIVHTYDLFYERVCRLAYGLKHSFGICPGDRVALFLPNHPAYLEIFYAVWQVGGVVVPINYKLHAREAAYILNNSGASLVFVAKEAALEEAGDALFANLPLLSVESSSYLEICENGRRLAETCSREPSDLAWLFYTSGTTGQPKGVMITHGNLQAMALSYFADVDDVVASDTILYAAPMSHGAGLYNFMHVLKGAAHCIPASGGFEPSEILDLSGDLGSVHMFAAPTMVRRLVETARELGKDGAGIKSIVYGGGPMYVADILEATRVMGPRFVQIYGQGECPMCITSLSRTQIMDRQHSRWQLRLGSVGVAQSCVEIRIVDETGKPCLPGVAGEITVKGAPVMLGYWANEEATKRTLREGWLHTGDVGHLDEDGFLTLTDRSKDVIISGGTNIYPREVEEVLLTFEGVREVSVIGQPDPEWGETIVAFVVASDTGVLLSDSLLDQHCLSRMARFKRPKRYIFVPDLPKNSYGKVLKTELRNMLDHRWGGPASTA